MMNIEAFFSDETGGFRTPTYIRPHDMVRLRFRMDRNDRARVSVLVQQAHTHDIDEQGATSHDGSRGHDDSVCRSTAKCDSKLDCGHEMSYQEIQMQLSHEKGMFAYYECEVEASDETTRYIFRIQEEPHIKTQPFTEKQLYIKVQPPTEKQPNHMNTRTCTDETGAKALEVVEPGRIGQEDTQIDEADDVASCDKEIYYYTRIGVCSELTFDASFAIIPDFYVPQWAQGAVMYQIFVDRFRCGNPDITVRDGEYEYLGAPVARVEWGELPQTLDVGRFHGGDLRGILESLDYLKSLGVDAIYLNPIFVSPSNHKYDAQDYGHIDPHLACIPYDDGTYITRTTDIRNLEAADRYFADFVTAVHEAGMKVIIDGVFNHCGSFHYWMDREGIYAKARAIGEASDDGKTPEARHLDSSDVGYDKLDMAEALQDISVHEGSSYGTGAYHSAKSPYSSYFRFEDRSEGAWPANDSYEKWWGNETLPKLDYEGSESLRQEIFAAAGKWLSEPYCVDGIRLDVAADLGHSSEYNHKFWRQFRQAVRQVSPEAFIIAEHYGDPSSWLLGDEWDSVMNYDAFMEPITWFLTGMEKHSDDSDMTRMGDGDRFFHDMNMAMSRLPMSSLYCAMNELSNHDHSRFLTRTNHMVGRVATLGSEAASQFVEPAVMRQAVIMQMTWPGAPTIYYGDEVGVCGFTDPDSRRAYPWGHEDRSMLDFHIYASRMHHKYKVLKSGSLVRLLSGRDTIAYARFDRDGAVVVVVCTGESSTRVSVPVWQAGIPDESIMSRIIYTYSDQYNVGQIQKSVVAGTLDLDMGAKSAAVYVWERES